MIKNIKLLELELHSECNRKCSWCPNSLVDRTFYKELDETNFEKIINELISQNYDGYISFSRYNEPFLNRELLEKRISYIRSRLPSVKLISNTNGDFNYEGIDLDELTVMDYDNTKVEEVSDNFRIMRLQNINNRAGVLTNIKCLKRVTPCYEPQYFVGIDYDGSITPCCNIRHDVEAHKPYILGNIKDDSLINILNSDKAIKFREQVALGDFPDICKNCTKGPGRYTCDKPDIMGETS